MTPEIPLRSSDQPCDPRFNGAGVGRPRRLYGADRSSNGGRFNGAGTPETTCAGFKAPLGSRFNGAGATTPETGISPMRTKVIGLLQRSRGPMAPETRFPPPGR
jgi:hypothetical protein